MNYNPSFSSSQKQSANMDSSGQGFTLPNKIHFHSRHNSPTDFSNLLIQNSKGTNSDVNNNLYEYTDSNYNPLQDSPFTNLTYQDYRNGISMNISSSQKPNLHTFYKGQQYEQKSDSDKSVPGLYSYQQMSFKPNEIITDNYIDQKGIIYPTFQEGDGLGLNIKSLAISSHSVKPTASNNKYLSDAKNNKNSFKLQDERKILQFDDSSSKLSDQINHIRSPTLSQKSKTNLGINISQLKTPQSDYNSHKNGSNSVEKYSNPILMQTFEDTPEIIKCSKNVLQPKFPAQYNQISLNNQTSSKTKKISPKNNINGELTYKIGDLLNQQSVPSQQQLTKQNSISQFNSQFSDNNCEYSSHKISKILRNNDLVNDKNNKNKPSNGNYYSNYNSNINKLKQKPTQDVPSLAHILNSPSSHTLLVPSSISTQKITHNTRSNNNLSQNKYSSNYKPKSITTNPLDESKHTRDNSLSNIQEQINILKDLYKIDLKNSPEKRQTYSHYQSHNNIAQSNNNINQIHYNINFQDYKKMIQFPQKKRENLEQQRMLIKQERNILQKEKELIEKEEEIFYVTSQGRLSSLSPERLSNHPLNTHLQTLQTQEQKRQNYYVNGNYQQDNYNYPSVHINPNLHTNNFSRSKKSIQQSIEAATLENSYDKKIRESQYINSEYKHKYATSVPYSHQRNNSVEQIKQNNFLLNTRVSTKGNSLHQHSGNSNNEQVQKNIKEQHFQRNVIDLEQEFQGSLKGEEERKLKDIINYFKKEQDSQKKQNQVYNQIELSTQTQTPHELSNQKSKANSLPLSMKKEISFQNKQPQIQSQSPEKTEETVIFDLATPQKDHQNQRELNKELNSQFPAQNNEIHINDANNKNQVKKKQIFSPINVRSQTPTTNSHTNNEKYDNYKGDPTKQENGVQVNENSFIEGRSSHKRTDIISPSGRLNHLSNPLSSQQKSIGYPYADRNSIKYGFSNVSSPVMAIPQNDISTNDFVESQIPNSHFIQNNQSAIKPEQQEQDKVIERSVSNHPNNHKASIEYVNQDTHPSQNRREKKDFLCFDCGNSQISTENNIVLDTLQDSKQQHNQIQSPQYQFNQPTQIAHHQTPQSTYNEPPQLNFNEPNPIHDQPQNEHQTHLQTFQNQTPENYTQNKYNPPQLIQTTPINQYTQEDQKTPQPIQTNTTYYQDSVKSPCFRDEKDDPVKRSKISPQRIFQTRPISNNTLKTEAQTNIDKISYDPNDYKHNSNVQGLDLSKRPLSPSFYPNNNQNKNLNNNTQHNENRPSIKPVHNPSSANNSFASPKYQIKNNNNQNELPLDFSYVNGKSGNISDTLNLKSSEKYCEKCLEFVSSSRYDTHIAICKEMNYFSQLDYKKQMDTINQKILKVAYVVKRKIANNPSPIRGGQQNQATRQLANCKQQQQTQQNIDNKLNTYCNYLNECLSEISRKNLSHSDFAQAKDDLKLIIQRLKSVSNNNNNMHYYGERALEIVNYKENLMIQNPI